MGHYEIYFKSAQAGENGDYEDLRPQGDGQLDKVWDGYEDGQLLTEIGATEEVIYRFYQARILQHSNRRAIFSKTERGSQLHNDLLEIDKDDILDSFWTVFVIYLRTDEALQRFKNQFVGWLALTAIEADSVGGDDSTYDYYPDRWDVAAQIAAALGMEEVYRRHRAKITGPGGRYSGEDLPEYIPEI